MKKLPVVPTPQLRLPLAARDPVVVPAEIVPPLVAALADLLVAVATSRAEEPTDE